MGIYKHPNSPYWYYSFTIHGKSVCKSSKVTDKKLAKKIFEHERSQFVLGEKTGEVRPVKLKDLINDFLEYGKVHKRSYWDDVSISRRVLEYFGENVMADEVGRESVEKFMAFRKQKIVGDHPISGGTINLEVMFIKAVYNRELKAKRPRVKHNPTTGVKLFDTRDRARTRHLTPDEQRRLLDACASAPMLRRIVLTALRTGLRQNEILALKWRDIDPTSGMVKITRTKSGKPRFVPLHADLVEMLNSLPRASEYVFPYMQKPGERGLGEGNKQGHAVWDGALRQAWDRALATAGIKDFRFHDLRHTVASDLAMKGASLQAIAAILGHATTRMSERYAHLSPNFVGATLALLPSLTPKKVGEPTADRVVNRAD